MSSGGRSFLHHNPNSNPIWLLLHSRSVTACIIIIFFSIINLTYFLEA